MKIRDIKIGYKLFVSFGVLLAFLIGLGILNFSSIRNIQVVNNEIAEINHSKFFLAEGRQDGLSLVYTGRSASETACLEDLSIALDAVEKMLEINRISGNFNKQAEIEGLALKESLQLYGSAITSFSQAVQEKVRIQGVVNEASKEISSSLEGLEDFGIETTDQLFVSGRTTTGSKLLRNNLVLVYEMSANWEQMDGLMRAFSRNSSDENLAAMTQVLDRMVSLFEQADAIFTTEVGHQIIATVRKPFDTYTNQLQTYFDISNSTQKLVVEGGAAGVAAAEYADSATAILDQVILDTTREALTFTLIFTLLAVVIGALLAALITAGIKKPIVKCMDFSQALSQGDFTAKLEIDQKDEVGMMGLALMDMVGKVKSVLAGIQESSLQVNGASGQISASAQSISSGTNEQASNMEEVSASLEELNSNIQQNSDNSQQSNVMTKKISCESEEGARVVGETVSAMRVISDKISVIQDIARSTNMLALNAAIEAARAGEAGKGFTVVASEIRKLAENSGVAAKEITEITFESVSKAEQALSQIEQIVPAMNKSSDLIEEISAASKEQSKGAEQINLAMATLDQVVQQNASAAEELASMSEELDAQARGMNQAINFFKLGKNSSLKENPVQYKAVDKERTFSYLPAPELNYSSPDNENLHSDGDFEEF